MMSQEPPSQITPEEDSTNVLTPQDQNIAEQPTKPKRQVNIKTQDIICSSRAVIDYRECLPGSIHESELTLSMPFNLDPMTLLIRALCLQEQLNALPEYVFGLRRGNSNQYGDQLKVRIQDKLPVRLIIGVKVPTLSIAKIEGVLVVEICGVSLQPLLIPIALSVNVPQIECIRQLVSTDQPRIVKIMMKKRAKKDGKIPFRNCDSSKLYVQTEVIGLDKNCLVETSPKSLILNPKAQFYVTLTLRMTEQFRKEVENTKGVYKIRRVLLLKIKQSSVYYHFPLEISLYQSDKTDSSSE